MAQDVQEVEQQDIRLTESAKKEIIAIRKEQNIPDHYVLRVGIQGGGCSGFSYSLAFDEHVGESDLSFKFGEVKVVVDYKSILYLKGVTLDFHDGLNGRGFVFNNPNATRTCGCGSSFSV